MLATLKAKRLVIVDERITHLYMYPRYARSLRGQRAYDQHKRNYGQNIALLTALRLDGMGAAMVVPGGVNRDVFEAYIQHLLLPTLQPGDTVIVDNLPAHHASSIANILRAKQCHACFYRLIRPTGLPLKPPFPRLNKRFAKPKPIHLMPWSALLTRLYYKLHSTMPLAFLPTVAFLILMVQSS